MRLPSFDFHAPDNLTDTLKLKKEKGPDAAFLAGGTDLLVNLKHGVKNPGHVISLKNVADIKGVKQDPGGLTIGAMTSLIEVAGHQDVQRHFPALAAALKKVGAVTLQHFAGAIGGNLLCNTRCQFFNQSEFWRTGFERCFKMGGQKCLVVEESKECSSVCQSDGAVMLAAYSAQATLAGPGGERRLPVLDLFSGKGEAPFTLTDDEILINISLFTPPQNTGAHFEKIAYRSAVDFPLMSAGAALTLRQGKIDRARIIVGAAGPAPMWVAEASNMLTGWDGDTEVLGQAAESAYQQCAGSIVDNVGASAEYRRDMVKVALRRAVTGAYQTAIKE